MGAAWITSNAVARAEATEMYGLIAKITSTPGRRDDLIGALKEGTDAMPGCLSYVVAKDAVDSNILWITEVWDTAASHDGSLSLPAVKASIAKAKPLIAGFEKIAATTPAWGVGFPTKI